MNMSYRLERYNYLDINSVIKTKGGRLFDRLDLYSEKDYA